MTTEAVVIAAAPAASPLASMQKETSVPLLIRRRSFSHFSNPAKPEDKILYFENLHSNM